MGISGFEVVPLHCANVDRDFHVKYSHLKVVVERSTVFDIEGA